MRDDRTPTRHEAVILERLIPLSVLYGDKWVRGVDPWHRDAFPDEHKDRAPKQGEREHGWYLEDTVGNVIAWVSDEEVFDEIDNLENGK